jgi:hypothetical protein
MTADHGDSAAPGNVPGAAFGRYSPHGESEGRFDLVVRGYDRRQVDEHIANLERTISRQRSEMQQARPATRDGGQVGNSPEKIGEFTGRLKSILEAAEEEAKEIRAEARNYARGEEEGVRARLADLERRRDAVVGDLSRVRGNLDALLARLSGPPAPKTPPEDNSLPSRSDKPLALRTDKMPPSGRPDQSKNLQPTPRVEPAGRPDASRAPSPSAGSSRQSPSPVSSSRPSPSPAAASSRPASSDLSSRPQSDSTSRPSPSPTKSPDQGSRVGSLPLLSELGRPKPSQRPATEDNSRPVSPRPSPSPSSTPGNSPGSSTPSPASRPSPSPRPRITPTSGAGPSVINPPGRGTESPQPVRNGVPNRENDTAAKRDEDGGPSAFGTGAR